MQFARRVGSFPVYVVELAEAPFFGDGSEGVAEGVGAWEERAGEGGETGEGGLGHACGLSSWWAGV